MTSWLPSLFGYNKPTSDIVFDTGDLILFSGVGMLDRAIRLCSHSKYSHCGIVLKDPIYIDPKLVGLYFMESTFDPIPDSEDGKVKFGVMIHPLCEVLQKHAKDGDTAYLRKIKGLTLDGLGDKIKKVYMATKDIPYNVNVADWIRAKEVSDDVSIEDFLAHHHYSADKLQNTRALWCSEFVGYFYVQIGVLDPTTPWTLMAPKHLSAENQDIEFTNGCDLSAATEIHP